MLMAISCCRQATGHVKPTEQGKKHRQEVVADNSPPVQFGFVVEVSEMSGSWD